MILNQPSGGQELAEQAPLAVVPLAKIPGVGSLPAANTAEAAAPRQRLAFLHRQPGEETGGVEDFTEAWRTARTMGRVLLGRLGIGPEADPTAATQPGFMGDIADLVQSAQELSHAARRSLDAALHRLGGGALDLYSGVTSPRRIVEAARLRAQQGQRYYDQYLGPGTQDDGQSDYAKDRAAAARVAAEEAMLTGVVAHGGGFGAIPLERLGHQMERAVQAVEPSEGGEARRLIAEQYLGRYLPYKAELEQQYPDAMQRVVTSIVAWATHQPGAVAGLKDRTSASGLVRRGTRWVVRHAYQVVSKLAPARERSYQAVAAPARPANPDAPEWNDDFYDVDNSPLAELLQPAPATVRLPEAVEAAAPRTETALSTVVAAPPASRPHAAEPLRLAPSLEELVEIARRHDTMWANAQAAAGRSLEPGFSIIRRLERAGVLEGATFEALAATVTESQVQHMERFVAMRPEERKEYFPNGVQADDLVIILHRDVNDFLAHQEYRIGELTPAAFTEVRDHVTALIMARRQAVGRLRPEVPGELSLALALPISKPDRVNGGRWYPRAQHFQRQLTANPGILFESSQAGVNARYLYVSLRQLGFRFTVPSRLKPATDGVRSRPVQP